MKCIAAMDVQATRTSWFDWVGGFAESWESNVVQTPRKSKLVPCRGLGGAARRIGGPFAVGRGRKAQKLWWRFKSAMSGSGDRQRQDPVDIIAGAATTWTC